MALDDCRAFNPNFSRKSSGYDSNQDVNRPLAKRRKTTDSVKFDKFEPRRLFNLAAEVVGTKIPFKAVEQYYQKSQTNKIDSNVVLAIIKEAFPDENTVALCVALSRSNFDGEDFYRESNDCDMIVKDAIQTGKMLINMRDVSSEF